MHALPLSRRRFLSRSAGGLGMTALASLPQVGGAFAQRPDADRLQPRPPHFPPRARNGIFIYLLGGTSQIELFDRKPTLNRLHGQLIPESFREGIRLGQTNWSAPLMG